MGIQDLRPGPRGPEDLSEMRIANDYQLVEIGSDYLLGVWVDHLGVEQVRIYRIDKG